MKIAATVIIYNPETDVLQHILSYYPKVSHVYIQDNSATPSLTIKNWAATNNNVTYYFDGSNEGIAKRLNQAAKQAIVDGYEWLLTMDQDSYFETEEIDTYFNYATQLIHPETIAMMGIEYEKAPTGEQRTFKSEDTDILITSGSLVNLSLFETIGGFDEALFIDEVDLEYCYRAITKWFRVIKLPTIFMQHSLGKVSYFRSFKSMQLTPRTLHSPLRVYYMVRNYLYVAKLYPNLYEDSVAVRKNALINRIKNNLLYGKDRLKLIRYLFLAYRDFRTKKMGKKK